MKYAIFLTAVISLFILFITASMEVANRGVSEQSFFNVYRENASVLFFLDRNSSFYSFYSFGDASSSFVLRKFGHFLVYGFIAGIIFFILPISRLWLKGLIASGSASLIGFIDEIHQYFLINRSGRLLDVYVNSAGSVAAVLVLIVICALAKWIKKIKNMSLNNSKSKLN